MGDEALRERIAKISGWDVQKQLGRGQYGVAYLVKWSDRPSDRPVHEVDDLAVTKVIGLECLPEKEHMSKG